MCANFDKLYMRDAIRDNLKYRVSMGSRDICIGYENCSLNKPTDVPSTSHHVCPERRHYTLPPKDFSRVSTGISVRHSTDCPAKEERRGERVREVRYATESLKISQF